MLTKAQEKLIKSLQTKKGRTQSGLCLVEGQKVIQVASGAVEEVFTKQDSLNFDKLVTTGTPQDMAATARIPRFSPEDVLSSDTILLLDGVQDPGNVGSIFRLCQGFGATLILIESADPVSPKVIRSSVGAIFTVPWITVSRAKVSDLLERASHDILRLEFLDGPFASYFEKNQSAETSEAPKERAGGIELFATEKPTLLVVGSEGRGIQLPLKAPSISISHEASLESLNVGHAVAIALHHRYQSR